jgi:hypothetical protein
LPTIKVYFRKEQDIYPYKIQLEFCTTRQENLKNKLLQHKKISCCVIDSVISRKVTSFKSDTGDSLLHFFFWDHEYRETQNFLLARYILNKVSQYNNQNPPSNEMKRTSRYNDAENAIPFFRKQSWENITQSSFFSEQRLCPTHRTTPNDITLKHDFLKRSYNKDLSVGSPSNCFRDLYLLFCEDV